MRLTLNPFKRTAHTTISKLFADGVDIGIFILEDVVREVPGEDVSEWKVPGATAIPSGTYEITITYSPRFGRQLPLLNDVPGYLGVRIHPGNTEADTEGCLLPGFVAGTDRVNNSREAFTTLFDLIKEKLDAGEHVVIEVKR